MKRIPVTKASYQKIKPTMASHDGKALHAESHKIDKDKTRQASLGGMPFSSFSRPTMLGSASSFYNNSYMGNGGTGFGDVPIYFALLNEQNGGILYYPVTLKEKYEWFRYFARSDAYVHAAINLLTDLPMSRLVLRMPKMRDKKLRRKILKKYETMVQDIKLFDKLHSILFESNVIGNCFAFIQYNEQTRLWDKIVILPPEEVDVAGYPMSNVSRIQYRPEILNALLKKYTFPLDDYNKYCEYIKGLPEEDQDALQGVDYELVKQLSENNGRLIMDTSPYSGDGDSKIGSFVFHFCEKRHEYQDLGVSPIECVLTPLLMKEHYKHTQLSLASRNMTPRNIITANEIPQDALDDLRDQVDQSMLSPDYSIVTNYDVQWNTIGAENRLIDLQREYETIENQLFAGFGVTRELLTGQGMYSGSKISIELLNTKFLLKRELLQRFVEENLFKPIAEEHGFYEQDEDGNRTWFYPRLSFSRLTIRDNSEVFDSLFQLYQKGSIPVGTILDLFNLDEDEIDEKLKKDMFTPKDATYNDMLRSVYSQIADKVANDTDLAEQIIQSLKGPLGQKLKMQKQEDEQGESDDYDSGYDDYDNSDYDYSDNSKENNSETDEKDGDLSKTQEQSLQEYLESIEQGVQVSNSTSTSTSAIDADNIDVNNSTSNSSSNEMSNKEANDIVNEVVDNADLKKDLQNLSEKASFKLN